MPLGIDSDFDEPATATPVGGDLVAVDDVPVVDMVDEPQAWKPPSDRFSESDCAMLRSMGGVATMADFALIAERFPDHRDRMAEESRLSRIVHVCHLAGTAAQHEALVAEAAAVEQRNNSRKDQIQDELDAVLARLQGEIRKLDAETSAAAHRAKLMGNARQTLRDMAPKHAHDVYNQTIRAINEKYHRESSAVESELKGLKGFIAQYRQDHSAALEAVRCGFRNREHWAYPGEGVQVDRQFDIAGHVRSLIPGIEARIKELEPIVAAAKLAKAEAEEAAARETIDFYIPN